MAVRLAIYNHKGGVGKSTTSVMLADGFACLFGLRVLVMDFDIQATSSKIMLGIDGLDTAASNQRTLADALSALAARRAINLSEYLCTKVSDIVEIRDARDARRIDILPSNTTLLNNISGIESALLRATRETPLDVYLERLLDAELRRFDRSYDVVIIDCPAGVSSLASTAVRLADHVIAPTVLEENSLTALSDFLQFILRDNFGLDSKIRVHILMTQYTASNTMQKEILGHIQDGLYKLNAIMRPIPYSTAIQRAMQHPGYGNFRRLNEKYGTSLSDLSALAKSVNERMRKRNSK